MNPHLFLIKHFYYFPCAENEQGIFDAILRGHIDFSSDPWPSISSSAKDLVKRMLCADTRERLSAVEILSKFYFVGTGIHRSGTLG